MIGSILTTGSIAPLKDDYLADIAADLDKESEKPKKKTKAQKRAERKERKRLRDIDNKKLKLRDHLQRELMLSKKSQKHHIKDWEQMCSEIKIVELREELRKWSENVKKSFERKNMIIANMIEEMENSESRQEQLLSKALQMIDYLHLCHTELAKSQKYMYEWKAEDLIKRYYQEMKRRNEELSFMHENSENVIHASNVIFINELKQDFNIYMDKSFDRMSSEIENRFCIRNKLVEKMNLVYHELTTFIDELSNTQFDVHKYERLRGLTERQAASQAEMKKYKDYELKLRSMIKELQHKLLSNESANTGTINDLTYELEYFQNQYQKMSKEIALECKDTNNKLRVLTTECYDLSKTFESYIKRGELLQSLASSCTKFQTKNEKIVLAGELPEQSIDVPVINESFKLKTLNLKQHLDVDEDELLEQNKIMRNFWHRHGMVEAQNMLLLEEKRKLTAENNKYIKFIKSMAATQDKKKLAQSLQVRPCVTKAHSQIPTCREFKLIGQQIYPDWPNERKKM